MIVNCANLYEEVKEFNYRQHQVMKILAMLLSDFRSNTENDLHIKHTA